MATSTENEFGRALKDWELITGNLKEYFLQKKLSYGEKNYIYIMTFEKLFGIY
jgi:hypothetical protein